MSVLHSSMTDRYGRAGLLLVLLAGCTIALVSGNLYWLGLGPVCVMAGLALRSPGNLYFLLLATIPLSAEVMLTETLGTDLPDEPLMWLLSPLLVLYAVIYRKRIAEIKADGILTGLLIAHLAWIFMTASMSPDPLLSFKYAAAKTWYLLAFMVASWLFLRTAADLHLAAWLLILPMTFACGWILWAHGVTGFSFDSVNTAVQPFFRNHVNYGAILVCLLPLPLVLFRHLPRVRLLLLFILLVWLLGLSLSYSRGAWVAVGVGLFAAAAIRFRFLAAAAFVSVVLVSILLFFFIQGNRYLDFRPDFERTIYHQDFRDHLQATYRLKDLSTAERFHRWIAGVRMVKDAPFWGHGPNRFYPAYKPYTVNAFQTYVSENPERSTVHNYFLLLAVEQGIPGLLIFLLLIWRAFHLAGVHYRNAGSGLERHAWLAVGSMLAMIAWLNMLSDLVETDKIGSLFFICIGLLMGGNSLFRKADMGSPEEAGKN
ncbi:MAG: O-antigen ligase family protein [Chitinophagaceae bacterium]|nr:O-antigen ligase family protein [Chitinophagaceae bacterium]